MTLRRATSINNGETTMLFRFLSKQSSRFAYAGLIVNVGKALVRSFSGMAHNGCALNINQNKAQHRGRKLAPCAAWRQFAPVVLCFYHGGCVKGAFPSRVYLPPSHKQIKYQIYGTL